MTRCVKHGERLVPATLAAYVVIEIDLNTNKAVQSRRPERKLWLCSSCVFESRGPSS